MSALHRSIDLSALVAIPLDHPLADIGKTSRTLVSRVSGAFSSAGAAAAVLGVGERTLRRAWAAMGYARKSDTHGRLAIGGQVLETIDKSAKTGKQSIDGHDKSAMGGASQKERNPAKVPPSRRKR